MNVHLQLLFRYGWLYAIPVNRYRIVTRPRTLWLRCTVIRPLIRGFACSVRIWQRFWHRSTAGIWTTFRLWQSPIWNISTVERILDDTRRSETFQHLRESWTIYEDLKHFNTWECPGRYAQIWNISTLERVLDDMRRSETFQHSRESWTIHTDLKHFNTWERALDDTCWYETFQQLRESWMIHAWDPNLTPGTLANLPKSDSVRATNYVYDMHLIKPPPPPATYKHVYGTCCFLFL
jgi:hypothetical protein